MSSTGHRGRWRRRHLFQVVQCVAPHAPRAVDRHGGARGAERDRLLVDASIQCGPAFLESVTDKPPAISRVRARDRRAVAPACAVGNSRESGAEARGRARNRCATSSCRRRKSRACPRRASLSTQRRARRSARGSMEVPRRIGVISAAREVRIRVRGGPVTQLRNSEPFARRKISTEKFCGEPPSGAFPCRGARSTRTTRRPDGLGGRPLSTVLDRPGRSCPAACVRRHSAAED